jgi:hypothetical protein
MFAGPGCPMLGRMKTPTLICVGLLALVAVPTANAADYSGKTKGGSSISLKLKGKKASGIRTVVPTICIESTGSGKTRAGSELFQPPGSFKLGRKGTAKALQPAAMNMAADATKTYTVELRKSGRRGVKGDLRVSFSFIRPGLTLYDMEIWLCNGTTSFSAKRG